MPIYQFRTKDGEVVERVYSMKDYPRKITLDDGREATLIIALTAQMKLNWEVKGMASDLPAEDAPPPKQ